MLKNKESLNSIVDQIMKNNNLSSMRPVIEKEILHYEIFAALYQNNLLDNLVFQGGTSLRLCRGSNRFSEDLDFAGGIGFSAQTCADLGQVIHDHIGRKFGLLVTVKPPKTSTAKTNKVSVDKWQVSVETNPDHSDIPQQKIKIEVANVPAYTSEIAFLRNNYGQIRGYDDVMVITETISEVMADKLLAYPACVSHIRYRDIWDLAWLSQQGAIVRGDLIVKKINDYHIDADNYLALLDDRIESIFDIVNSEAFLGQMKRFIAREALKNTLIKPGFNHYLASTLKTLLTQAKQSISSLDLDKGVDFSM